MVFRKSSPIDRATDQIVDGASETADLVADALADAASSAMDVMADGSEALAAVSIGRLGGLLKRPKALLAVLVMAAVGAYVYRRFISGGDDSVDETIDDIPSLQR